MVEIEVLVNYYLISKKIYFYQHIYQSFINLLLID